MLVLCRPGLFDVFWKTCCRLKKELEGRVETSINRKLALSLLSKSALESNLLVTSLEVHAKGLVNLVKFINELIFNNTASFSL